MKRSAPATERNREPIAAVLREVLPEAGTLLEIASGTGEHAVYFAGLFPALRWQPSDPDPQALASIGAWRDEAGLENLLEPVRLDSAAETWPVAAADAILCVNMVHISPWAATEGLMRGAGRGYWPPERRWFCTALIGARELRPRRATRPSTSR